MILGIPDPDPLVRGMDTDPDSSIIMPDGVQGRGGPAPARHLLQ
jgi:hypothetical protein